MDYQIKESFDENASKYRCCCFHITTGAKIIRWLGTVILVYESYYLIESIRHSSPAWEIAWRLLMVIANIAIYTCLSMALKKEVKRYCFPFLVYEGYDAVKHIIETLLALFVLFYPGTFITDIFYEIAFDGIKSQNEQISPDDVVTLPTEKQKYDITPEEDARFSAFFVLFLFPVFAVQIYFWFGTIYRYYFYLKDKEEATEHIPI